MFTNKVTQRQQSNNIRGSSSNPWGTPLEREAGGNETMSIITENVLLSNDTIERMLMLLLSVPFDYMMITHILNSIQNKSNKGSFSSVYDLKAMTKFFHYPTHKLNRYK